MRTFLAALGLVFASGTAASAATTFDFNEGDLSGLTAIGGNTAFSITTGGNSCGGLSNGSSFLCATGIPGGTSPAIFDFPDLSLSGFTTLSVSFDIAGVATNNNDILEPIGANFADFVLIRDGGNVIELGGNQITGSFVTHTFDLVSFLPTDGSNFQLGIQVSGDSEFVGVDNISFIGAIPEPATWLMMIIGFAGTGLVMRRRRMAVEA